MAQLITEDIRTARKTNYDILSLFLDRWSPRAMSGEELSDEELFPILEAARWAPSSFNNQPWRFLIARKQNPSSFERFFALLNTANQAWAKSASVLIVVISSRNFDLDGRPSVTHAFDAGAAWENLALEATRRGLVAHGMEGFNYARARRELKIPEAFEIHAMVALGWPGDPSELPQKLQKQEHPTSRRPLREIVFDAEFGKAMPGLR